MRSRKTLVKLQEQQLSHLVELVYGDLGVDILNFVQIILPNDLDGTEQIDEIHCAAIKRLNWIRLDSHEFI